MGTGMSWSAVKLKSTYRDQLIRELQHLAARRAVKFSPEVMEVMQAVRRDEGRDWSPFWTSKDARNNAEGQHDEGKSVGGPAAAEQYPGAPQPGTHDIGAHNAGRHSAGRHNAGHSPFLEWVWQKRTVRHDDILEASEIYLLEATLIEHLEGSDLKMRIVGFRDMLSNLMTNDGYRAMQAQFCNLATEDDPHKLRGEARALVSRLYRRYEGVPAVERLRRDIVFKIYAAAVCVAIVVFGFVYYVDAPSWAWVAVAGATGASVSTMSRLYDLDARHEPFKTWLTIENGQMTLILAPVVGATFALVLLSLFWGGIITGTIFPDFSKPVGGDPALKDVMLAPDSFAKLMLWGFASGWAERMVPDVLNKLTPKATAHNGSKDPAEKGK